MLVVALPRGALAGGRAFARIATRSEGGTNACRCEPKRHCTATRATGSRNGTTVNVQGLGGARRCAASRTTNASGGRMTN